MLVDLSQKLPPLTADETYVAFLNSLRFREGFGIIFLDCPPDEANRLIPRVQHDLPGRNIEVLDLVEPINNLYKLVEGRADRASLNILFIRGLEKSLEADVKPGYKGLGNYYNLNTIPPILSHLNQQRENFRDHFGNICFVFVLSKFAIRYFVRRAPDFYDWNSGVFNILNFSKRNVLESSSPGKIWYQRIWARLFRWQQNDFDKAQNMFEQGRYEEAITFYELAIHKKSKFYQAWFYRGNSLQNLGRYKEAVDSYDRTLSLIPDHFESWYNRGISLDKLGRFQEAIKSYDRAVAISPGLHEAWFNRGILLANLGRYEEASESFNRSMIIKNSSKN
jgi:tetratricopeptide (TPR) repeat protein